MARAKITFFQKPSKTAEKTLYLDQLHCYYLEIQFCFSKTFLIFSMDSNYAIEMVDENNIDEIFEVFVDQYGQTEPISEFLLKSAKATIQDTRDFFNLIKPYLTSGISQVVRDKSNDNAIVTVRFAADACEVEKIAKIFYVDLNADTRLYYQTEKDYRPAVTGRLND